MATFKLEHLSSDEVEYELQLRGLPPYSTRIRLSNLAERCRMEEIGQIRIPTHCLNKDLVAEVNTCFSKLEILEKLLVSIAEKTTLAGSEPVLISRLLHLNNRINRITTDDHRLMKQADGLSQKCVKYVAFLNESLNGKASLSDLLKSEKLVSSETSFLGISSSTRENFIAKGTSDMSLSLFEAEKGTGKPIAILPTTIMSPVADGGEELSELINESCIISDLGSDNSDQGAVGGEIFLAKDPKVSNELDLNLVRERFLRKKFNSVANFDPQVLKPTIETITAKGRGDEGVNLNRDFRIIEQKKNSHANRPVCPPVVLQPQAENKSYRYRNPIPNWNLYFSGDGKGLDLNQFFTQVQLMARADRVSDVELLASAIHLFKGPARNWYMAFESMFDTWDVLKSALRQSFLSEDGDFLLLKEIEQRRQGKDEPFILYLSTLLNIFKHLKTPLGEKQRLDLVIRNMQPYLADRLALTEIYDTHHLSMLCKKIEDARDKYKSFRQTETVVQSPKRNFYANELSSENNAPQRNVHFQKESCWNCLASDHTFKQCSRPKMRIFCYFCGELGQLAYQCTSCEPKNRPRRPDHFGRDGGKF